MTDDKKLTAAEACEQARFDHSQFIADGAFGDFDLHAALRALGFVVVPAPPIESVIEAVSTLTTELRLAANRDQCEFLTDIRDWLRAVAEELEKR